MLKRISNSVCTSEGLEDNLIDSVQQTLNVLEQDWKKVLDDAVKLRDQAEFQLSLEREMDHFHFEERIIRAWILELEERIKKVNKDTPVQDTLLVSQVMNIFNAYILN